MDDSHLVRSAARAIAADRTQPDPLVPAKVVYGDRVVHVHKSTGPLSAGDIRYLAGCLDDLDVPSAALIEVRTPLAPRDRRMVDLAVWVTDNNTEGEPNA